MTESRVKDQRAPRRGRSTRLLVIAHSLLLASTLWNPFNLHLGWLPAILVAMVPITSGSILFATIARRCGRVGRIVSGVALGTGFGSVFLMTVLLAQFVGLVSIPDDETVLATQGEYQLVQVEEAVYIDAIHRVELRRDIGPLAQRIVVWEGLPEHPGPSAARFTGPRSVWITGPKSTPTCEYRATFDDVTLDLDHERVEPADHPVC